MRPTAALLALLLGLLLAPAWGQEMPTDGTVTLPLEQFLRLKSDGGQTGGDSTATPVPFMFSQGDYRLGPEQKWVRVEASLSVWVYHSGWLEVPLLPADVLLQDATIDGKPLALFPKDGQHHFAVKGTGSHALKLVYYLPITSSGATRSVAFRSPNTSVTNVRLVLPGKGARVEASPAIPLRTNNDGGRTITEGSVPGGSAVTLSWTPLYADPTRRGKVTKEKPRLYGRVYQLVVPAEKSIRSTVRADFTIQRNEVDSFVFKLSEGVEVEDVRATGLDEWELSGRELKVKLSAPVTGSFSLTLLLERPLATIDGEWAIPTVEVTGVEQIKGSVGVATSGGIEVSPVSQKEVRSIDVRELPPEVASMTSSPLLLAYEYHRQPFSIQVEGHQGKELAVLTAVIDSARAATLVTEDGKVFTAFDCLMRNNQRQSLQLKLPEGAELLTCSVDGDPAKPIRGKDGQIRLPLSVSQGDATTFPVRIVYFHVAQADRLLGSQTFQAPELDVPVSVLNWTVFLPTDREVVGVGGTMREGLAPVASPSSRVSGGEIDAGKAGGLPAGQAVNEPFEDAEMEMDNFPQAKKEDLDDGRMRQMVQEATRGSFPVDIQIPETGQMLNFSQLLITGEAPTVTLRYYSARLAVLAWLGVLLLTVGLGLRATRTTQGWTHLALAALVTVLIWSWVDVPFLEGLFPWILWGLLALGVLWLKGSLVGRKGEAGA